MLLAANSFAFFAEQLDATIRRRDHLIKELSKIPPQAVRIGPMLGRDGHSIAIALFKSVYERYKLVVYQARNYPLTVSGEFLSGSVGFKRRHLRRLKETYVALGDLNELHFQELFIRMELEANRYFGKGITDLKMLSGLYPTDVFDRTISQSGTISTQSSTVSERYGANDGTDSADIDHSIDYRSVRWFGQAYTFSRNQAACVKVMWEEFERKTCFLGEQTILEHAGLRNNRLRDVFKTADGLHPAWNSMIIKKPGTKDIFGLSHAHRES